MGKVSFALGLGVGYVLGARAGRSRFEQIQQAAVSITERPEVQEAVGKVRENLPPTLQKTVDGLTKSTPAGAGDPSPGPTSAGSSPLPVDDAGVAQAPSAVGEPTSAGPATGPTS